MAAWGVIFLAGMVAAGSVSNRLKVDFSLPGQPGYETAVKILDAFGNGGDKPPSILVVTVPPARRSPATAPVSPPPSTAIRTAQPALRVVDLASPATRLRDRGRPIDLRVVFTPPVKSFGSDPYTSAAQATLRQALPGRPPCS